MVKKVILGIFVVLFAISPILAEKTEIIVKTIPFADIQISIMEDGLVVERLTGVSNQYGDSKLVFDSDSTYYTAMIFVKQNYENVMDPKKLLDKEVGQTLSVRMIPVDFEEIETPADNVTISGGVVDAEVVVNTTSQENGTIEIQDVDSGEGDAVTGAAVIENDTLSSAGYIVGGFLALGMIAFLIFKVAGKKRSPKKGIKVKKMSEIEEEKKQNIQDRMAAAEKRIEDAKKELEEIKKEKQESHKSKHDMEIEAAKRQLIEDQKRLMELRKKKEESS